MQGAKIDAWGVGTKLITAFDQPALGAVYKIVSIEDQNGNMRDTLKLSSNAEKVSTPGKKQVWRITNNLKHEKSEGDWISVYDENPEKFNSLYMFHPKYTYINKIVEDFKARPLLQPIYESGQLVYTQPDIRQIREYAKQSLAALWEEYKRDLNPQEYPVDLSEKLYNHKMDLINQLREENNSKAMK